MQYRSVGRSGLRVSAIGLGCNNLGGRIDADRSGQVVHSALDHGINFFDVADVYGRREAHYGASEETLGAILKGKRHEVIIATKFGLPMNDENTKKGASRHYIREAVEGSLRRLQTDYIDLYQLHTPDPLTPIEETIHTLDNLVQTGKILYAGCCNLPVWEVARSAHVAREKMLTAFISSQDEYSLLARDAASERLQALDYYGMGFFPYFPLASGMLTGKYKKNHDFPYDSRFANWHQLTEKYISERNWQSLDIIEKFARKRGMSVLAVAFNWLLAQPIVSSVIAGATSAEQVTANVKSINSLLTISETDELTALLQNIPLS